MMPMTLRLALRLVARELMLVLGLAALTGGLILLGAALVGALS